MPWTYEQIIGEFRKHPDWVDHLKDSLHGIERECLRVSSEGDLAMTPHPLSLGSALKHPSITTDFSEAQLELVTPAFLTEAQALNHLHTLHQIVAHHLPDEFLWPSSAPCPLPSQDKIPVANYGSSSTGEYKRLYRLGLIHRYGAKMQTLSGIHYNFSFHDGIWKSLHSLFSPDVDEAHWLSQIYLKISRNFLRMGWLNTYLFGATPALHHSFFDKAPEGLQTLSDGSYYHEYATSLRMSDRGYFGKVQRQVAISLNNLDDYVKGLRHAISTSHPDYEALREVDGSPAKQLNTNLLQDIAEYYARVRPKARASDRDQPLDSMQKHGIAYLEVRSVDISPFDSDGLLLGQLLFLHTFLIYCLFKPSPEIPEEEQRWITENQNTIAQFGRDPNVELCRDGASVKFRSWAKEILDEMKPIADFLDQATGSERYSHSLNRQVEKWTNPEETASARVLRALQKDGMTFRGWGMELARQSKARYARERLPASTLKHFDELAAKSLKEQASLESVPIQPRT